MLIRLTRKLAGLTSMLVCAAVLMSASLAVVQPQCSGCTATVDPEDSEGNGVHIRVCPGKEYYLQVTVVPKNGKCLSVYPPDPEDPCIGSPCSFDVTMGWKQPTGTSVDLCNTWGGTPHCVSKTANGENQSFAYTLNLACNNVLHDLSNTATTPCGTLSANVLVKCTVCDD